MEFFYIDYMNGNKKERNIGFVRVEREKISIGLRGVPVQAGKECEVIAEFGEKKVGLGRIFIKNGYGAAQFEWPKDMLLSQENGFFACNRLYISLYGNRYGICTMRMQEKEDTCPVTVKASDISAVSPLVVSAPDKWHQLMATYKQVHIVDEAETLFIYPKDIIILNSKYHDLSGNSFVLHSYYNYRQMLLFRYMIESKYVYYLGVPGINTDRDKKIAKMFGFDAFEKSGTDGYGYYLKEVEI